jgi:hypothetical protein
MMFPLVSSSSFQSYRSVKAEVIPRQRELLEERKQLSQEDRNIQKQEERLAKSENTSLALAIAGTLSAVGLASYLQSSAALGVLGLTIPPAINAGVVLARKDRLFHEKEQLCDKKRDNIELMVQATHVDNLEMNGKLKSIPQLNQD